ncbi:MAG: hypothetical protein COU11_01820 [Candidatus Harrisonbacteria bacterium CG10_big_fil_rev_8_21_14_0_10_49_15]|uniref:Band 7 domain-containing protein n=1 Tax=Candidatus Harrisonbacteria bacterium CG10_big_fil_rev_8_21_14_0_10_49_15 TaxID=1974587 RepID=A0A2H0ULA5_9BACT|nr:MAG: hypothetical protein COU11_01820 [Candidatus Harrisonbacteria bacterium CG10_big_fil_rev_8_21_14_0_10_49_15]
MELWQFGLAGALIALLVSVTTLLLSYRKAEDKKPEMADELPPTRTCCDADPLDVVDEATRAAMSRPGSKAEDEPDIAGLLHVFHFAFWAFVGLALVDGLPPFVGWPLGLVVAIVPALGCLITSFDKIEEENPPSIGLVTIFGRHMPTMKDEGLKLFFRWFGLWVLQKIQIDQRKVNVDLGFVRFYLPDGQQVDQEFSFTYSGEQTGHGARNFVNAGGHGSADLGSGEMGSIKGDEPKTGVPGIVTEILINEARNWFASPHEGPKTVDDAYQMIGVELPLVLLLKLDLDNQIPPSINGFPILDLFAYLRDKRAATAHGRDLSEKSKELEVQFRALSPDQRAQMATDLHKVAAKMDRIQHGQDGIVLEWLGMRIDKLVIGRVRFSEEYEKSRLQIQVERRKAESAAVSTAADIRRVRAYKRLGLSPEPALMASQVNTGNATRSINTNETRVDDQTRESAEAVARLFAQAIAFGAAAIGEGLRSRTPT